MKNLQKSQIFEVFLANDFSAPHRVHPDGGAEG